MRDLPDLNIEQGDAFAYVERAVAAGEHFDYVAVDLYRGDRMAHGVVGRPFLRGLQTLAEPRGLVIFNLFIERRVYDRIRRIERVFRVVEARARPPEPRALVPGWVWVWVMGHR